MVADMNVTGVSQNPLTPADNVTKKEDASESTVSFAEVLASKEAQDTQSSEKNSQVQASETRENKSNTKDIKEDESKEPKPNPITTKPNKTDQESQLTKALKEGDDGKQLNNIEVATQKTDSIMLTDKKDANTKKVDLEHIKEEQSKNLKTLTDVKKEAQARNLNLQKIEIIEQGKTSKVDPRDLIDRSLLDSNKERLALNLQDKGTSMASSLSRAETQSELNKKEALLAELLNRYDAAENAKRKAQNASEQLKFKVGDGDKSMVIERSHMQPKNIIESKFRNENIRQEFLEKLQGITGDGDLSDLIEAKKAILQKNKIAFSSVSDSKTVSAVKPGQGVVPGQVLDIKDLKNTTLEMQVDKPFDSLLAETMKADSKAKDSDVLNASLKNEKKIEEKPKEGGGIEGKQDVGSVHTKQEVSMKNAMARETMRNFASQIREEILNYKPPITKINLELNPVNLGQVSLSISKKGKDLQVSITSNANVMTMFVQNAQELRQNLIQIGFNNLDLNFGTHDGQSGSKQSSEGEEKKDEKMKLQSIEEADSQVQLGNIPQSLEIVLPEYA